ncbi:MAG: flippase-like domain-containing protein [Lentisphaeria bacterium]|nr:flippase-like domain-containing protein [Lentisphaeria bacterium]
MTAKSKTKSLILLLIKLGIAGVIVYYFLLRNPREIFACLKQFDIKYILAAGILYFSHMLISAWRWGVLARIPGIRLGHFEAVSLTMQGYFFSLVIPGGAIGGDVVKMGVLARRTPPGEKFEGIFSILMDRIIGMIALFVLALILIPFNFKTLQHLELPGFPNINTTCLLPVGLILLCLAGLCASGLIFFHKFANRIPLFALLLKWGDKLSHGLVSRMTAATDTYSRNKKELLFLVIVSVFGVHLLTAVPVCLLLSGMGVSYSICNVITALTIGNIIGLIPLFPAGLGGRDVTAIAILTAGGIASADAKTAQLVYTTILLIVSLADGLFFIFDRGRKTEKTLAEENHE